MKLVVGITNETSVVLIKGQLRYFSSLGFSTYLLAPEHEKTISLCQEENATLLAVPFKRDISLWQDIKCLLITFKYLYKLKPEVINVGTPKAGLLGALCAKLIGVKKIIYTCRGFRYEQEGGIKRKFLMLWEKFTCFCAHKVICISSSLRQLGIDDGIFSEKKSLVIGKGSSNGIELNRFSINAISPEDRLHLINNLKLERFFVFGFVGRLVDRKGINELFNAFEQLCNKYPNIKLLIVGRLETNQLSDLSYIEKMLSHRNIVFCGPQQNIPLYMSLMDVFVMPSWNEGFGNVLVQAASMKIPVISTNSTGCKDAVSDGFNGVLVERKNQSALFKVMESLLLDEAYRNKLAVNGVVWARNFEQIIIWDGLKKLYTAN